jgi:putative endonuclease
MTTAYYTYVLKSLKDNQFYIGYSSDLENRLSEHSKGHVTSTKARRPILS